MIKSNSCDDLVYKNENYKMDHKIKYQNYNYLNILSSSMIIQKFYNKN